MIRTEMKTVDYYQILGVERRATPQEIATPFVD
jgi:DnaJ-class molecular chaperone